MSGPGTSRRASAQRELRAAYRATRTDVDRLERPETLDCPECGAVRSTPESLRVHRWIAHDVRASA